MHLGVPHPRRSPERRRRLLASEVFKLVDDAERPPGPLSPAAPLQRDAILSSRNELLGLADALADTAVPVSDQGVGLVEQLIRDDSSPVYAPLGAAALDEAVRGARAALAVD